MTITKEQFGAYEAVRQSGVTNMFDVTTVQELSNLTKDQIFYIMQNYRSIKREFEANK